MMAVMAAMANRDADDLTMMAVMAEVAVMLLS